MAALWSASNKEGVCAHSRIQATVIIINQFILINQRQFKRNSEPNCFSVVEKIMHDAAQTMLSMDSVIAGSAKGHRRNREREWSFFNF